MANLPSKILTLGRRFSRIKKGVDTFTGESSQVKWSSPRQ